MNNAATKTAYTFVVMPFDLEVTVVAENEKAARTQLWDFQLSDAVKDGCESIDCVEETSLPA